MPRVTIHQGTCDLGQCGQFSISISNGQRGMTVRFESSEAEFREFLERGVIHASSQGRCSVVPARTCSVSFVGTSGIRQGVEVEAESLYEAAVKAIARFRSDPWMEQVGNAAALDIKIRESSTKHSVTLKQVESVAREHECQPACRLEEDAAQDDADERMSDKETEAVAER